MSTTSTWITVKAALIAQIAAALPAVQVSYAWPGPQTESISIFGGRHPAFSGQAATIHSTIPVMAAGRRQRQETYQVELTLWTYRPDLTPADAQAGEQAGFDLLAGLENVLANTPRLGLTSILWAKLDHVDVTDAGPVFFEKGWASVLVAYVEVEARLT